MCQNNKEDFTDSAKSQLLLTHKNSSQMAFCCQINVSFMQSQSRKQCKRNAQVERDITAKCLLMVEWFRVCFWSWVSFKRAITGSPAQGNPYSPGVQAGATDQQSAQYIHTTYLEDYSRKMNSWRLSFRPKQSQLVSEHTSPKIPMLSHWHTYTRAFT